MTVIGNKDVLYLFDLPSNVAVENMSLRPCRTGIGNKDVLDLFDLPSNVAVEHISLIQCSMTGLGKKGCSVLV